MHVIILGAGVIGVSTAHQLLADGHRVTVVDEAVQPAEGTSFANGGLVCPGHATAWASPHRLRVFLRSLYRRNQPVRFKPKPDPALAAWGLKFLRQCTTARAAINTANKSRLCRYSQAVLHQVVDSTGVEYGGKRNGILYLHRTVASLERAAEDAKQLIDAGQRLDVLDRDQVLRIEPALAYGSGTIAGAVYAPTDETGDACRFTRELANWCATQGVEFRFDTRIVRLVQGRGRIEAIETDRGPISGDAYVLALGVHTPGFARQVGLNRLPIYPAKGYSMTLPLREPARAPMLGGIDEHSLLVWARLDDRLRITSKVEIGGFDTGHRPKDFARMLALTEARFPGAADLSAPNYWAGLRPLTPEGTPRLGPTPIPNLYLNAGHGHLGWTMASGSGRVVADVISGRPPAISLDGMRYT